MIILSRACQQAVILLAVVALGGCGQKPGPLAVYGEIPDFILTAHTGEAFRSDLLEGKVWVADFIFTNCTGPCPRMSSQMRQVQREAKDLLDVRLVSFTVDPARDTSEVLAAYANRYQAEPDRWYFLTGPQEILHQLKREAFKLGEVDGSLNHSTYFVLVDQRARVRGYYGTSEGNSLQQLVADVKRLLEESS
jgi:protein SCO1/2